MKPSSAFMRYVMSAPAALLMMLVILNGCVAGAMLFGGAAALVINEGFIAEDTYGGVVKSTPGKAYDAAITVMDTLCPKIILEKAFRKVSGTWRNADVEVTVEDLPGSKVSVHVKARKYMLSSKDTAIEVFQRILMEIKGL